MGSGPISFFGSGHADFAPNHGVIPGLTRDPSKSAEPSDGSRIGAAARLVRDDVVVPRGIDRLSL
jgi:hypothetical protein